MAQQWRIKCYNCGSEPSERLRMHTQLTGGDKQQAINVRDVDEDEVSIVVECNVCDNIQFLDADQQAIDRGETPLLEE